MEKSIETIAGDTEGVSYTFPVYRFAGIPAGAPSAYLQAALHAGEQPGTVAIHALMPKLRAAEAQGRIRGNITIVPAANPIGRAQYLFGDHQGRYHLGTCVNFNREFPKLETPDPALLPPDDGIATVDRQLKVRLLKLSLGHDIVLDLHCDDEGVPYFCVPAKLWPAMSDCAAAFGAEAVIICEAPSNGEFDEASIHPYLASTPSAEQLARRVITTVELRGILDVHYGYAEKDAAGLYRLLVARGVIEDRTVEPSGAFEGVAAPTGHVERVKTPKGGALLYDIKPGDRIAAGQRIATVVHTAGEDGGGVEIFAPQAGYVLTRRARRIVRANEDIVKLVDERLSANAKPGSLEE
ncbi:MAG: succinylglutamate desuccinylase/aspartoacylase family protein [Mesorhizobium sp.]|uniref:succinylglutamate desuccinylase/aspartoacylase domain-containing protein n=1 Tax=Mesorhizobium sp. TaxID=1871066 RepID=UPI0011F6D7B1|nr:succinylglutamate desuccinylase/aspartoacylase family protein [Mesorhizobium sp.]TIP02019.1 MAG: succinylglutamate desuccinylase/aspartoacylase family protein [Mesorhizobium sp.]